MFFTSLEWIPLLVPGAAAILRLKRSRRKGIAPVQLIVSATQGDMRIACAYRQSF
jgi:hypothetical protein